MRLSIGGIFAKCFTCQGEDFFPADAVKGPQRDVLRCAACGHEMVYAELLMQIGGESVQRAVASRESKKSQSEFPGNMAVEP